MARVRKLRPGTIGAAIALWDVWRRLTPKQRAQLVRLAKQHGPKVARTARNLRKPRR
ncbi:MAG TPA: hypothetical protein VMS63_06245 [Gaiellaceae bacterium]|nr:hypothetical protein [Gaiellaceae bacterium]